MSQISSELDAPDDPYKCFTFLYELGVTDGLPVVPPTPARLNTFVSESALAQVDLDTAICSLPPSEMSATLRLVAANAIMAGCRPEYLPVLIAALEAITEPIFNLPGIATTTNPVAPMMIVNGPIRGEIGLNCGRDLLGPGHRANASIGRTLRLLMRNVGGLISGETDKATHGMPGKYTMCIGELEDESPWTPLSVERGHPDKTDLVTVAGIQGTRNLLVAWKSAESIIAAIADGVCTYTSNNYLLGGGNPVLIVNPGHANLLARQGVTKEILKQEIFNRSKVRLDKWPQEEIAIQTERSRHIEGDCFTITRSPEDILIVVAGGPEAYHITYCASFGDTWATDALIAA